MSACQDACLLSLLDLRSDLPGSRYSAWKDTCPQSIGDDNVEIRNSRMVKPYTLLLIQWKEKQNTSNKCNQEYYRENRLQDALQQNYRSQRIRTGYVLSIDYRSLQQFEKQFWYTVKIVKYHYTYSQVRQKKLNKTIKSCRDHKLPFIDEKPSLGNKSKNKEVRVEQRLQCRKPAVVSKTTKSNENNQKNKNKINPTSHTHSLSSSFLWLTDFLAREIQL